MPTYFISLSITWSLSRLRRVGYHRRARESATYDAVTELGDAALAENQRVRTAARRLRAQARALRLRAQALHWPKFAGGSDDDDDHRAHSVLRDFARRGTPTLFGGYSRGSVCQACGTPIKVGAIEYEVETTGSKLRIDAPCYRILVQELSGAVEYGPDEAAGA